MRLPDGLCCPVCKAALRWQGRRARCRCGAGATLRGGRIPDFLGDEGGSAETAWTWPPGFLRAVEPFLLDLRGGGGIPDEKVSELHLAGLVDERSRLTELGTRAAYDLAEYSMQARTDQVTPAVFADTFRQGRCTVVDLGGGAGQTLVQLDPPEGAELVCVDKDLVALAIGTRLTEDEGRGITFVRASGEEIPFVDGTFTHAICRNSLQHMLLPRALREIGRVLRPGGLVWCRVEGPGYDLGLVRQAATARERIARLRDLSAGLVLAVTGRQRRKEGSWKATRTFGTIGRYRTELARAGLEVMHHEVLWRAAGFPVAFDVVARRPSRGG